MSERGQVDAVLLHVLLNGFGWGALSVTKNKNDHKRNASAPGWVVFLISLGWPHDTARTPSPTWSVGARGEACARQLTDSPTGSVERLAC